MCSFLFARTQKTLSETAVDLANSIGKHRGPDATHKQEWMARDGYRLLFLHNLLDISGRARIQPVLEGNPGQRLCALFNGEIYNFSEFTTDPSDTDCIIPAYRSLGRGMARAFDGEFAFAIYDEAANQLFVASDPFLTKPLYFGWGPQIGDFGVATCASALSGLGFTQIKMADPNSSWEFKFDGSAVSSERQFPVVNFDLCQHKQNYDDWNAAFFEAVRKRATHGARRPAVFLSSGYDSGGICLALNKMGLTYDTFSLCSGENRKILNERIRINRASSCQRAFRYKGLSNHQIAACKRDILHNVESFPYVHEDAPGKTINLHSDGGAIGSNFIAREARLKDSLVNLSGSGSDEILSDYGFNGNKYYHHSEFGGLFPFDLAPMFPWKKFYGDTQRSYLFKEEFILGRHGVEGRYPFLDRGLVQEFLWLSAELKNKAYKAPLAALLVASSYPFEPGTKRGFSPHRPTSVGSSLLLKLKRLCRCFADNIIGK